MVPVLCQCHQLSWHEVKTWAAAASLTRSPGRVTVMARVPWQVRSRRLRPPPGLSARRRGSYSSRRLTGPGVESAFPVRRTSRGVAAPPRAAGSVHRRPWTSQPCRPATREFHTPDGQPAALTKARMANATRQHGCAGPVQLSGGLAPFAASRLPAVLGFADAHRGPVLRRVGLWLAAGDSAVRSLQRVAGILCNEGRGFLTSYRLQLPSERLLNGEWMLTTARGSASLVPDLE